MIDPEDEHSEQRSGGGSPKPGWRRGGAAGKPSSTRDEAGSAGSPFRKRAVPPGTSIEPRELPLESPGAVDDELSDPDEEQTNFDRTLVQPGAPAAELPSADSSAPIGEGTLVLPSAGPHPDQPTIPGVTIRREIGRGGMGVVFEGTQGYLDRRVAVKVLINIGSSDEFTRRFQREAKILASLSHPNIVGCYQAGVADDGRCFLVMEYIDGPTLGEWIEANAPLPPAEAMRVCRAVAEALACAYGSGIIHRDVKPPNVLLKSLADSPDGFPFRPMLADLGLARASGPMPTGFAGTNSNLTVQGTVMGSPPTMAPEQFDNPDAVDFRTDIYGLGCVLFHCLTGKLAFPQNSLTSLIARKAQGPPPDPNEFEKAVPREVASLVRDMLQPDREQRPSSYEELLERMSGSFDVAPARRSKGRWVAAVVGLLLIGGLFAFRSITGRVDDGTSRPKSGPSQPVEPDRDPESARDPGGPQGPLDVEPFDSTGELSQGDSKPAVDPEPTDPPEDEAATVVDPPPPPVEPEPAAFVLPALAAIGAGETWTMLDGSLDRSPLEAWHTVLGQRDAWSPVDEGDGAQALLFADVHAAWRELPAPPWTMTGTFEFIRPRSGAESELMIVVLLQGDNGIAFRQKLAGGEVLLQGTLVTPREGGGWVAGEALEELSIGATPLDQYRSSTPVSFRAVWDAAHLVLSWSTADGQGGARTWPLEDIESLGAPIGIGLQLEAGAALVHDLVVVGG